MASPSLTPLAPVAERDGKSDPAAATHPKQSPSSRQDAAWRRESPAGAKFVKLYLMIERSAPGRSSYS